MENNLFLIATKCKLEQLAHCVSVTKENGPEHVAYSNFWENIVFIWYNQDTHLYTVKEILDEKVKYFYYREEKELFRHMDDNGIDFVTDSHPLGEIFLSYSAAYLAIIRWVGEVAWTRKKYEDLIRG